MFGRPEADSLGSHLLSAYCMAAAVELREELGVHRCSALSGLTGRGRGQAGKWLH